MSIIDQLEQAGTYCMECGRPWGAILKRGVEPTDDLRDEITKCLQGDLLDAWLGCDVDDGAVIDFTQLPPVHLSEVVFVTDALADFASEHLGCSTMLGVACWQVVADTDLPGWILKGRRRRMAYLWDCCNIGHADSYVVLP